jgi:hypothetical protein
MLTRTELAAAFLNTTNDSDMKDRWLPDEDWVRRLRNQPEYCKVSPGDLNGAISRTFDFIHNKYQDPKSDQTIYHNKRRIVINAKDNKARNISFYYALSSSRIDKPEMKQKGDFWQAIWDDPERSNRMLKRTTLSKNELPNKKQRVVSPEPDTSNSTEVYSNPPQTFQEALRMLLTAWKSTYGDGIKFPTELIAFFPTDKAPLVVGKHIDFQEGHQESKRKQDSTLIQAFTRDIALPSGQVIKNVPSCYELYTSSAFSARKKDSLVVKALRTVLVRKRTDSTLFERRLLAGWSASHPQVAVGNQEQLLALGRYSLLLEIQAECEGLKGGEYVNLSWLTLENAADSSPSERSLRR